MTAIPSRWTEPLLGHTSDTHRIRRIAWAPNGHNLAGISEDDHVWIEAISPTNSSLTMHANLGINLYDLAWNPATGSNLAIACEDGTLHILDTSGNVLRTLDGHQGRVYGLAWNPDGSRTISLGENRLHRGFVSRQQPAIRVGGRIRKCRE